MPAAENLTPPAPRDRPPDHPLPAHLLAFVLCLLMPWLLWPAPATAEVTAEQLERKMASLATQVRAAQRPDGSFRGERDAWPVGQTALAVLALRAAGTEADDPAVRKGAEFLVSEEAGPRKQVVYQKALKIMALRSVDPERYRPQIAAGAAYLVRAQQDSGGWSYEVTGRPDNSNSQFALLGLHSAALSGVKVPPATWRAARAYFLSRQHQNGGWSYLEPNGILSGSMTAAGVASLFLCDLWLHVEEGRCGLYASQRPLRNGLNWLARNFSVQVNPNRNTWKFYYLYGLERAGSILARRYLGQRDWYRAGVEHLVQGARGEVLAGERTAWPLLRRCFMLLFLGKGNAPVVVQKAQYAGGWNKHRYDAHWLVHFVGRQIDQPMDHQIVPLRAPLAQLMAAPVLYVSGSGEPQWHPEEKQRLKDYLRAGGFILAEAAGGDERFDTAFRRLMDEVLPPEQALEKLPETHPLYSCHFELSPQECPPLEVVRGPCWLNVVYAPNGLSCPWDVARFEHTHFRLGANVIAYVTGLENLEGKLARPTFHVPREERPEPVTGGAFVLGQLVHSGRWRPHKTAWRSVLEMVSQEAGISIYARPVPIDLAVEDPFRAHMLYVTGIEPLQLGQKTPDKLRLYVERGGFIFAEAACGSRRFDESFRRLMRQTFPEDELETLPVGHPLLETGPPLDEVNYTEVVREGQPGVKRPMLEFLQHQGRVVVVYSKYDLSSAIEGHPCFRCPSVLEPSASRLALKVLLYGLSS